MAQTICFKEKVNGKWAITTIEDYESEQDCRKRYLQAIATTFNSCNPVIIEWYKEDAKTDYTMGKKIASFNIPALKA